MTENLTDNQPLRKPLILKFEYDGSQYELSSLTTSDTVGDLRAVICSMLNIDDFKRINLKKLQPTKLIDTSDDKKPLSEVFQQTRERIVVEEVNQFLSGPSGSDHLREYFANPKHSSNDHGTYSGGPQLLDHISQNRPDTQYPSSDVYDEGNQLAIKDYPENSRQMDNQVQTDFPVCSSTGYLLRHPVPSNNSCLFISVHFCLTNGVVDDEIGKSMRKIIAETVASDKERFDDAFLGKSNADYCKWILDDNHWGGAIELSILCKYYETEIVAIDVKNTLLNRFGEDSQYKQRMLLLYDGLHYDPLKFQPLDDSQPVQTLFSTDNLEVLQLAEELAREAKQSHQFTDMNTIKMKCVVCNAEFDARAASEHASKTGHVDFVEK